MDVVYPWNSTLSRWEELRYSIRSLRHCRCVRDVWLVADRLPPWSRGLRLVRNDLRHTQPWLKSRYLSAKLLQACLREELSNDFLFMCDDFYLLRPVTKRALARLVALRDLKRAKRPVAAGAWRQQLWHTRDVLEVEGLPVWNYETHIPKVVNKQRYIETMLFFGYQRGLLWETAYFNLTFKDRRPALLNRGQRHRAGFYGPTRPSIIRRRMDEAMFLNHNEAGLDDNLKSAIAERFPLRSRFEQ